MANIIDLFSSKYVKDDLVGNNTFFNNEEEIKESNTLQKKYISNVDYSNPTNFARFGSAEEYYKNAINYINSEYPYAGSTTEKLNWVNSLNEFEFHIYDNEFPRSTGYVNISGSQYINVYSHVKEPTTAAKDAYIAGSQYTANTILNLQQGFTFESWLKFGDNTQNTNILNITAVTSSETGLTTINLLTIYKATGSYSHFEVTDGINTYQFSSSVPYNEWHHYSFYVSQNIMSLSIDGQLIEEASINIAPGVESYIFVPLGLMWIPLYYTEPYVGDFEKSSVFQIGGGGLLSVDESRFWNGKRSVEKIGRYWFTHVDGNDFSDPNNSNLLFYYRYNEGWDPEYGLLCLDYSGRDNDGDFISYEESCRVSGSAIDMCGFVQDKEKSDIVYKGLSYSQTVKEYSTDKISYGISYDETNIHLLYNKFPSWLLEQEEEQEKKHLKQIIQIISSYFDDLYNKISEITEYKKLRYDENKDNIYPFYDKILTSAGFDVTELFSNLDIIEKISSRNDITLFDEDIHKIKNTVFRNIYNNLSYILKSKGTDKSIKSFLKSYGVNDDLVRINLYSNNMEYSATDRSKETVVKKKTVTMTGDNSIYLSSAPIIEDNSLNYYTLEACIAFPNHLNKNVEYTASIFGLQNNSSDIDLSWLTNNYQYYVTLEHLPNVGSRFVLTDSFLNTVSSSFIENLYDNSAWNIVLRKKPDVDTLNGYVGIPNYTLELYGVNKNTHIEQEFSCSLPYMYTSGYLRYYIGARRTDMSGSTINEANSKFLYCNFWSDYLNNNTVISHNKDILNYGVDE